MPQLPRQANQCGFGRCIGLDSSQADRQTGAAGNIDDAPRAGGLHAGRDRLAQIESTADIDRKNRIPLLRGDGFKRTPHLSKNAASVVHQNINLSAGTADFVHQHGHGGGLGDVHDADLAMATGLAAQLCGLRQPIFLNIKRPNIGTVLCQRNADRAPKPMRRAANNSCLARKIKRHDESNR